MVSDLWMSNQSEKADSVVSKLIDGFFKAATASTAKMKEVIFASSVVCCFIISQLLTNNSLPLNSFISILISDGRRKFKNR